MTGSVGDNSADDVLGAIRALEGALQERGEADAEAGAELEAARTEAQRILAAARDDAEMRAAERRDLLLENASTDAERIRRNGEEAAAALRARVETVEDEAIERAVALVLPMAAKEVRSCSSK